MNNLLQFIIHLTLCCVVTFGVGSFYKTYIDIGLGYPGHSKDPIVMLTFLTFWGQLIHMFYFFWCVVCSAITLSGTQYTSGLPLYSLALKVRDVVFRSIAFPIGITVTFLFWSVYSYDREFIFPELLDKIGYPGYVNHIQHTLPGIVILFEMFTVNHQYHKKSNTHSSLEPVTTNMTQDIVNLISFLLFYLGCMVASKYFLGYWPYPLLEIIPLHSKIVFIISSSCFFLTLYTFSRMLSKAIWGGSTEFWMPKAPPKRQQSVSQKKKN